MSLLRLKMGDVHPQGALDLELEMLWRDRLTKMHIPIEGGAAIEADADLILVGDWRKWCRMDNGLERIKMSLAAYKPNGQCVDQVNSDMYLYGAPEVIMHWMATLRGLRLVLSMARKAQSVKMMPQVWGYNTGAWPYERPVRDVTPRPMSVRRRD